MTTTLQRPLRAAPSRPRRRFSPQRVLSELVLDVLALGGLVCIAAVVAALVFDITLIMFKTGSMTPTIPTGSLAVVRQIPAADARVGDVVTVDRDGQLPVTHRIISIVPGGGGAASIEMKGDANDTKDPYPYEATTVRKVLWSAPGLGYTVAKVSNPKVLAGVTMAMALFVTWSFWPRSRPAEGTEGTDDQEGDDS